MSFRAAWRRRVDTYLGDGDGRAVLLNGAMAKMSIPL